MTHAHDDAMSLLDQVKARREAAGLKVTWLITDEAEPRTFTAYAKDAEQAKLWRETAYENRKLIS